ncbi:thermonuclease family protein [Agromyces sp. MMS24-K17]|uniref:thermonuclease family protein n=1 Tax=Agromyces sp. MMS24-K17 TaxID=3372850 RepID=UPI003753EEA0
MTSLPTGAHDRAREARPQTPARGIRPLILTALGIAAGAALVGGGLVLAPAAANAAAEPAVVESVIDGDTVDVRTGDLVTRVRLLNIDTPELAHGSKPAECLALEATQALAALLPVGSPVTLDYDVAKVDRYGRTLAAVTNANGVLVETELARQGLGARAYFGDNARFLPVVTEAEEQAQAAMVGMWNPALECSPEALVNSLEQQSRTTSSTVPKTTAALAGTIVEAEALSAAADSANATLDGMSWLRSESKQVFSERIAVVATKAAKLSSRAVEAIGGAKADEQRDAKQADASSKPTSKQKATAKKKAKAQAKVNRSRGQSAAKARAAALKAAADREAARIAAEEAARIAAEQEAARVAAEEAARVAAEEAARVAADEAARAAAQRTQSSGSGSSSGGSSSGGGDGGGSTYTGCRNYNGYGMIDTKGRHFEPIPC